MRAPRLGHLQGGHADPRGHTIDQHPFPRLQLTLLEQGVIGRQVGQGDCGGFFPAQAIGDGHGFTLFHHGAQGKGAWASAHDALAQRKTCDICAYLQDRSGTLQAHGLRHIGLAMQTVADDELTSVQAGRMHLNANLCRPQCRLGAFHNFDHGLVIQGFDGIGLHLSPPWRQRPQSVCSTSVLHAGFANEIRWVNCWAKGPCLGWPISL